MSLPIPLRRLSRVAFLLIFLPVVLLACGDSTTEPEPDPLVTGAWSGTSQGVALNLTLSEGAGGSVSGSGNLAGPSDNFSLIVRQGTHSHPSLSLVLGATGYEDINFTGQVLGENQLSGTLNGSGFDDFNLNLSQR